MAKWRALARGVEKFRNALRKIVVRQRTPEQQRQRHKADVQEIGSMREPPSIGARIRGDSKLAPQLVGTIASLLDRGAERLFSDRHPALRRDDEPLRRDQ